MSAPSIPDKARELEELRALSALPAWKDRILPKLAKLRDAHNEAGMARNSTPEKRAEHIEAYHDLRELISFVPDRIEALTRELTAHQRRETAFGEPSTPLEDRKQQ